MRRVAQPYYGKAGVTYDSIDRAWQRWVTNMAHVSPGYAATPTSFTERLLIDNRARVGAVDRLGSYNSESPGWKAGVMTRINQVRAKIGTWKAASRR